MVFIRDEGSEFDVPLEAVWAYLNAPERHASAHHHRAVRRTSLGENSGEYSWEQDFEGSSTRFTMRWSSLHPVGISYQVLEGPFQGSRFLLTYHPKGAKTGVSIMGEFMSPTLPPDRIAAAVESFFSTEFEQDLRALRERPDPR
ncbi:MAG TPA: hypothetical protein VGS23_06950 [Thermoplasmata archaeon]|nr:hypothetical protein [Thermoplasmata archaeon]